MSELEEIETHLLDLETVLNKTEEILNYILSESNYGNLKDSLKKLRNDLNDQLQEICNNEFESVEIGQITQDRCNLIKNEIFDFSKSVINIAKEKYKIDENSDEAELENNSDGWTHKLKSIYDNFHKYFPFLPLSTSTFEQIGIFGKNKKDEEELDKIYLEWWTQKWKSIHENFQKYFYTHIRPNFSPDEPSYLNQDDLEFKNIYIKTINETLEFKNIYIKTIDETFSKIESSRKERQALIYNRVIHSSILSPKHGNIEIRRAIAYEAINCIGQLTDSLNNFLWKIIDKMIDWMRIELWNIPEIREEVIGRNENLARSLVQHSFDALVKRLSRPATDIFLRFPRSKIERLKVFQEFQMELLVLDKFVVDGKLHYRGLYQYLANGELGKFDLEIDQCEIEPTKSIYLNANKKSSQFEKLEFTDDAKNFEQVNKEIEDDLKEFLECMKNSVFYGSGIQSFFFQELENIRRKFINLEEEKGRWWHYVSKYLKKKDGKVVILAPNFAEEIKARGKILMNIKEMKKIYDKYSVQKTL